MNKNQTTFGDIKLYKKIHYKDYRGYFGTIYDYSMYDLPQFVLDNISFSKANTIRGLHGQKTPYQQAKYIYVISGKILDVQVKYSKFDSNFGKYQKEILNAGESIYIPQDYLHGFYAIEDSLILYKCTNPYNKKSEIIVKFDDSDIGINWGIKDPILSEKDRNGIKLKDL